MANCYCCTCEWDHRWDPACHLHGAHGVRGCEKHGVEPQNCDCGCEWKVVNADH